MSVTREKSTCAVCHPVSRSWAAWASRRLVFPYRRGAASRTPTRSPARRPSVVSSSWRSMRSSGATGPSKRNGVPCAIAGQVIPDQYVRQILTEAFSARQREPEGAPAAVGRLDPDAPAVRLDDAAAHGQADARALGLVVGAGEHAEDSGRRVGVHAHAVVAHGD